MTAANEVTRPLPEVDRDSEFYWQGLKDGKLLLQKCESCEKVRFPAMPSCPYCGAVGTAIIEGAGTGVVYSWIRVRRAFHPAFEADAPYIVATVELSEGPRMVAWLDQVEEPEIGMQVKATFVDHTPDFTELRFVAEED